MHIAITNFKGGQGKTSLAYHFASQYGFGIVTNDPYTPLERWLDEERLLKILPDDPVPEVPADWDVVFDLGGYLDRRMATLLAGSDWIIVPFIHDPQERDNLSIEITVACLEELKQLNDHIVIVANRHASPAVQTFFEAHYPDLPYLPVKQSNAFAKSREQRCSIRDLVDQEMGFAKLNYQRLLDQLDALARCVGVQA